MRREHIVFWLDQPSPHQSSYLRALAKLSPEIRVTAVFEHELSADRVQMGWRSPDLTGIERIVAPDPRIADGLALKNPESSVHVFGGLRLPLVQRALGRALSVQATIGVVSETRASYGLSGCLRIAHSFLVERSYRPYIDFVMAIGHTGEQWFRQCGYASSQIYPWAYFCERLSNVQYEDSKVAVEGRTFSIAFVGRCVYQKGVDTLIKALSITGRPASLKIVGDGPDRASLERLSRRLGLAEHIHFLGTVDNDRVPVILATTDLLVLPSRRKEGWGAVVNEALMSGVPAIVSDQCGAADLVSNSCHGEVFPAGSVDKLADALSRWMAHGPLTQVRRAELRRWSQCISGEAGAQYLFDILRHVSDGAPRPTAPWLTIAASA